MRILLVFIVIVSTALAAYWFLAVQPKNFAEPRIIELRTAASDTPAEETAAEARPGAAIESVPAAAAEKSVATVRPVEMKEEAAVHDSGITQSLVGWGFAQASNRSIDTVIIHTSYNALSGDVYDRKKLFEEYRQYGVAPHYLIDRTGRIFQLVADKNVAYHAGSGETPDGRDGVNNFSLGIEVMNTEEAGFTAEQYAALNSLLASLKSKYKIKYVLGHSDIAPGRKSDPWNIEWSKVKK